MRQASAAHFVLLVPGLLLREEKPAGETTLSAKKCAGSAPVLFWTLPLMLLPSDQSVLYLVFGPPKGEDVTNKKTWTCSPAWMMANSRGYTDIGLQRPDDLVRLVGGGKTSV